MSSSIVQINQELEESARAAGTGLLRTLVKVTFPLIRNAIANSFLYVFINSFRELGAALLLITGNILPLSVLILQSYQNNPGKPGRRCIAFRIHVHRHDDMLHRLAEVFRARVLRSKRHAKKRNLSQ